MYNKEEMVAVSKLVKKFGEYSSKLNENEDKRIVIMKDNKPSMVLLDIDEYEHLYKLADLVERLEIAEIIPFFMCRLLINGYLYKNTFCHITILL